MKWRNAVLAAALLLGTGSAQAAGNSYADVPKGDPSYDGVDVLIREGVITGYDAEIYRKAKTATRYEMARFVANAVSKYDQASDLQKQEITELVKEYAQELDVLGVRTPVTEQYLPKKAAPAEARPERKTTVRFDGETLVDATHVSSADHEGTNGFSWRQRLHINADFNDRVSYHSRLQTAGKFGSGKNVSEDLRFTRSYVQVKDLFGIDQIQLGRTNLAMGRYLALALQGDADGAVVRDTLGKVRLEGFYVNPESDTGLTGLNVNVAPSKSFEWNAMYFKADASPSKGVPKAGYGDLGFSAELSKGLTLVGEYTKADSAGDPDAWAAQLSYNWVSGKRQKGFYTYEGLVNNKVPHDQAIGISYRDIEKNALPGSYGNFYSFGRVQTGQKGWMIGYQNMILPGIRLSLQYQRLEDQVTGKTDNKYYSALDMYFN